MCFRDIWHKWLLEPVLLHFDKATHSYRVRSVPRRRRISLSFCRVPTGRRPRRAELVPASPGRPETLPQSFCTSVQTVLNYAWFPLASPDCIIWIALPTEQQHVFNSHLRLCLWILKRETNNDVREKHWWAASYIALTRDRTWDLSGLRDGAPTHWTTRPGQSLNIFQSLVLR